MSEDKATSAEEAVDAVDAVDADAGSALDLSGYWDSVDFNAVGRAPAVGADGQSNGGAAVAGKTRFKNMVHESYGPVYRRIGGGKGKITFLKSLLVREVDAVVKVDAEGDPILDENDQPIYHRRWFRRWLEASPDGDGALVEKTELCTNEAFLRVVNAPARRSKNGWKRGGSVPAGVRDLRIYIDSLFPGWFGVRADLHRSQAPGGDLTKSSVGQMNSLADTNAAERVVAASGVNPGGVGLPKQRSVVS